MDTLEIEDEILEIAKEFYNYPDIHLTFVLFKDFSNKFARIAIDGEKQYILNCEKWYDFTHNVLKDIRNNEKLSRNLKLDEQFSYFGGIVDESIFLEESKDKVILKYRKIGK
ncbi:hypothetical protein [Clostridium sp.]|uniref:hypothetical protein n=1 Tax=Clostridium sp. TaxID=1506 RepID=UPI0026095A37|nr:hypothetical protein [Clostridium sp.]